MKGKVWAKNPAASAAGFSLVELTIVVAIMAVLASSAVPLYELSVKREKEQELRIALRQIREALDTYKRAVNDGRVAREAEKSDYPRKLEDLVNGVPDIKDPKSARSISCDACRATPCLTILRYPPPKPGGSARMKVRRTVLRKARMFSMCTRALSKPA